MNELLREESARLARSWMKQDAADLRDYLVSEVEDPRLNLQSILTRHVLASALLNESPAELMRQACRHRNLRRGAVRAQLAAAVEPA